MVLYIDYIITGERRYSTDLLKAGLKIPYKLLFRGKHAEINKLMIKHLFSVKLHQSLMNKFNIHKPHQFKIKEFLQEIISCQF